MILPAIENELAAHGLIARGGTVLEAGEVALPDAGKGPAKAVLLVGQRGAEPWAHFTSWMAQTSAKVADPLDTWSRIVIGDVAARFGAFTVSPSDRPYLPFQKWAMRAERLQPSPLGILMHPKYGLWHAYRGAILFGEGAIADEIAQLQQPVHKPIHLCEGCVGKPCLKACPVGAHSRHSFAYDACLGHARSVAGRRCRSVGCLDRNACPEASEYRYPPDMQAFHMAAFLR